MTPKKKKKNKRSVSGGGAKQFIIMHCEKIVVVLIVIVAAYFALIGMSRMGQVIAWQPEELERTATEIETGIRNSIRTAEDEEGIEFFDHAALAEQIRSDILTEPYRTIVPWNPDPRMRTSSSPGQAGRSSPFGIGSDSPWE